MHNPYVNWKSVSFFQKEDLLPRLLWVMRQSFPISGFPFTQEDNGSSFCIQKTSDTVWIPWQLAGNFRMSAAYMLFLTRAPAANTGTVWARCWKLYAGALRLWNYGRNTHPSVLCFPFHQMFPFISTCSLWLVCQGFLNKQNPHRNK